MAEQSLISICYIHRLPNDRIIKIYILIRPLTGSISTIAIRQGVHGIRRTLIPVLLAKLCLQINTNFIDFHINNELLKSNLNKS